MAFVLLASGAWVLWGELDSSPETPPVEKLTREATRGAEEDPNARLDYELRRLRDPKTGRIPEDVRKKELEFAERMPERISKSSSDSWQPRGPANVGGRSRALAIDLSDGSHQTLLAGGVSGGMWRTTDGGTSWTRTFAPDQRPNVTALDQDPRSGRRDVWYAGTGEYRGNSASGGDAFYRGDGIYRSVDGGQSWTLLSSTTSDETSFDNPFDYTWAVEVDPTAPTDGSVGTDSEVYAATYGRIYRTTDGGDSWSVVLESSTGGSFSRYTDVEVTSNGVIYAALSSDGDRSGLFVSTTGASGSWTEITPSGWPSSFDRTVLAVNPSNEDQVWAVAKTSGSGPNGHQLWRYNRGNGTWTEYTDYLPNRGGTSGTFNSQFNYDLIVAVHPDNGDVVFVGGRNLWRLDVSASASDANTWIGGYNSGNNSFGFYNPSGSDPHHPDQHALAFEPGNGDVMWVGSDGGIHRTDDNRAGGTGSSGDGSVLWTDLNNGYFTTQFYTVCQFRQPDNQTEQRRIAGGMQDNGTWNTASTNASDPWTRLFGADGGYCSLVNNARDNGTSRYVSIQGGDVYQLNYDASGNFEGYTQASPTSASGQLFINPFAVDPSDADVMYYPAGGNLWRNSDLESSPSSGWTEMTSAEVSGETITALGVSAANNPNVLYYGTSQGTVRRLDNANTISSTTPPTDVTGGGFPRSGYVSSIAVHPSNSNRVMVVFSNYNVTSLFYSTDGGASWTAVEGNLGADEGFSPSARSAAILPRSGTNTYYVGTSVGVYSTGSLDGSNTTWMQEGASEIGDVVVDQVQARASAARVIAGTHANGTYALSSLNASPTASDDSDETEEGTSTETDVLANDSDPDGSLDASTVAVQSAPSDGTASANSDGTITYAPDDGFTGTDSYTYTVEDEDGAESNEATVTIEVVKNDPPTARFTFDPSVPNPEETVTFDAGGSDDPDGSIQSYEWDFDDDGQTDATGETASTSFSSAGDKPVTLTVEDDGEATDSATETVPVDGAPQVATNAGLTLTAGQSADITTSELEVVDQNDGPSDLTYTITSDVGEGEIVNTSTSAQLDQGDTFTQADIDNGDLSYDHTASNANDDSFDFEAADPDGQTAGGTFDITVNPAQVSISGQLSYPAENSGPTFEADGTALGGETVVLFDGSGAQLQTTTTGSSGGFTFGGLAPNATYEVEADISSAREGVSIADAQRIVDHRVSSPAFANPQFQEEIADVNDQNGVTSLDALLVARFVAFGDPLSDVPKWHTPRETVNVQTADATGVQVLAASYADANLDGPASGGPSPASLAASGKAGGSAQAKAVEGGEPFEVPVRLDRKASVGAFEMKLGFDAEKASFEGASAPSGTLMARPKEDGTLKLAWLDKTGETPMELSGGDRLVTLTFKAAEEAKPGSELGLELEGGELVSAAGETLGDVGVRLPVPSVGAERPEEFAVKGTYPNPTTGPAALEMALPREAQVTVTVYNALGQQVQRVRKRLGAGSGQTVQLRSRDLPSGQYFYRVETDLGGKTVRETGQMTITK